MESSPPETARRPSALTATDITRAPWPASAYTSAPLSRSHTFTVPSFEPETARRPSALTFTKTPWPWSVYTSAPLSRSHTFTLESSPPETTRRPSPLTATDHTTLLWPWSVYTSAPLSRSHTFTVPSSEPETARRPSALTATDHTPRPWPLRTPLFRTPVRVGALLVVSSIRGLRAPRNRWYCLAAALRQSTYANDRSVPVISASSSRRGMKRLSRFVGSRNRAVWRSSVTQSEPKACFDIARTRTRDCSSPSSIFLRILSPGWISHSLNQTRRPSFLSRLASLRTVALSLALWLRKTSYVKVSAMGTPDVPQSAARIRRIPSGSARVSLGCDYSRCRAPRPSERLTRSNHRRPGKPGQPQFGPGRPC